MDRMGPLILGLPWCPENTFWKPLVPVLMSFGKPWNLMKKYAFKWSNLSSFQKQLYLFGPSVDSSSTGISQHSSFLLCVVLRGEHPSCTVCLKGYSHETTDLFLFLVQFAIKYGGRGLAVFSKRQSSETFQPLLGQFFLFSFLVRKWMGEKIEWERDNRLKIYFKGTPAWVPSAKQLYIFRAPC